MRVLFVIAILNIYVVNIYSQEFDFVSQKEIDWKYYEEDINSKEKLQAILNLKDHSLIQYLKVNPYLDLESDDVLKCFHFVDFDLDGDFDIVYFGDIGVETSYTILFKNTKGEYKEIDRIPAEVIKIEKITSFSPLNFVFRGPVLGGNDNWFIQVWNQVVIDGAISLVKGEKIYYHEFTSFPVDVFKNPIKFKITNEKYFLRSNPIIKEQNVVGTFTGGTIGYAISSQEDDTGRVWWFVCLNVIDMTSSEIKADLKKDANILGWMSSRFLEKLN